MALLNPRLFIHSLYFVLPLTIVSNLDTLLLHFLILFSLKKLGNQENAVKCNSAGADGG